jgi:HEAT repeat protein
MKIYSDFHDFFNKNESEMEPPSILPRKHKNSIIPQINGPFSVRNERLKSEVSQIISFVADKKSIPALINLLNDKEYDVRWIAAESLIKIGRSSVSPLIRSIKNGKNNCYPGKEAYRVLQSLLTSTEQRALHHLMSESLNL